MQFAYFLTWTDEGRKGLKDGPARAARVANAVEKLGGKLIANYITPGGASDVVSIVDLPPDAAPTLLAGMLASGLATVRLARVFSQAEWGKAVSASASV